MSTASRARAGAVVSLAAAAVIGLSGCHASAAPAGVGATGAATAAASTTGCSSTSGTIPAGHYAGSITATLTTTMHLDTPAGSLPNAGGGTESMHGRVSITSNGSTVNGSITLDGLGLSQVGMTGAPQVHSVDNGELLGHISGPASAPKVTAILSGEWSTLDAPLGQSSGSETDGTQVGLHVTSAGCGAVTGDAIAMFGEIAQPVSQYVTIGGSGTWTADRT